MKSAKVVLTVVAVLLLSLSFCDAELLEDKLNDSVYELERQPSAECNGQPIGFHDPPHTRRITYPGAVFYNNYRYTLFAPTNQSQENVTFYDTLAWWLNYYELGVNGQPLGPNAARWQVHPIEVFNFINGQNASHLNNPHPNNPNAALQWMTNRAHQAYGNNFIFTVLMNNNHNVTGHHGNGNTITATTSVTDGAIGHNNTSHRQIYYQQRPPPYHITMFYQKGNDVLEEHEHLVGNYLIALPWMTQMADEVKKDSNERKIGEIKVPSYGGFTSYNNINNNSQDGRDDYSPLKMTNNMSNPSQGILVR